MYPLTSIIILTKNNVQFTERCLLSLWEQLNPHHTPFEIFIADEGSVDGTEEMCELYKDRLTYMDLSKYDSFSSRNNAVARKANGFYLWFLNNDTELLNNNLHYMLEHFVDPQVGMVSNMHLFPDGSLNHMGIAFDNDLQPQHIFPHEDPNLPYINYPREIDVVTAASVIVRKDYFEELGGFDEQFKWGYEDIDLCLRFRDAGYRIICDNSAHLIHFGQSTYGRQDHDKDNYQKFSQKWKGKVTPNIDAIYAEKETYLQSHKILPKAKQLARKLMSKASDSATGQQPENEAAANSEIYIYKSPVFTAFTNIAMQIETNIEEPHTFVSNLASLANIAKPPQDGAMLLSTTHFSPEYLEGTPEWVREYRSYDVNYERTDGEHKPDYWTKHILDSNFTVLASSQYCADFLLKAGIDKDRVHVVPHGFNGELLNYDFTEKEEDKITILLVINTNDEVRYGTGELVAALRILVDSFPEQANKTRLLIKNYGGRDTQAYFKAKEYLEIVKLGIEVKYESRFLSEADLAKLYYQADAFIAPFRGEGFGMKVLDAAVAGLPIICPSYGGPMDYLPDAEHLPVKHKLVPVGWGIDYVGLFLDQTYVWAEADPEDMAKQISELVKNIDKHKQNALTKRDKLRAKYNYKTIWRQIREIDNSRQQTKQDSTFEFFDTKLSRDEQTPAHSENQGPGTTLVVNTNRPENLNEFLNHLDKNFDLSKELNEILFVDDASNSEEKFSLDKFGHLPVRYVRYEEWGGSGYAREIGLRYARNDHIIIVGDDIKPMPGFFSQHRKYYTEHNKPYLLVGHVEWDKDIRNIPVANFTTKITGFQFDYEGIRNEESISYTRVYTSNLSFRKSDIQNAKQHFKLGMILYEDTIWAEELSEKGFDTLYSRRAYALHSHKVKTDWWTWLADRSRLMGNYNVGVYTSDVRLDTEIGSTKEVIDVMSGLYSNWSLQDLVNQSSMYDIYTDTLRQRYDRLLELEQQYGYNLESRNTMYGICGQLHTISRFHGIAEQLSSNPAIAKSLAYLSYRILSKPEQVENNSLKEAVRATISLGRKRLPFLFEPIYKLGKLIKRS